MNNYFIIAIIIAGLMLIDVLYTNDDNKLRRIYVRSALFCILSFLVIVLVYYTNSMDMASIELVLYLEYIGIIIIGSMHILYVLRRENRW